MKTYGIKRQLRKAKMAVNAAISGSAKSGGMFAGPLSGEGYNGGYRDALSDVSLALDGVSNSRSRFWPIPENST